MAQPKNDEQDEISMKDFLKKVKLIFNFFKSKWITILFACVIGGFLGLTYSIIRKPLYIASCNFVLDDGNKAGGLGQYAGLASMAGIDLGNGNSGIFQGDNILELYKSRTMIKKTLLCKANFNGHEKKLIERYIEFNSLKEKWNNEGNSENLYFNGDPEKFNRKQDSLITDIVDIFNKKQLSVVKPDKKLSIINVEFSSKDELFSKEFVDKLVENVNEFYTQTKTKKSTQNVNVLQRQADSVKSVLNYSLNGVANAIDANPNANPQLLKLRVSSQKRQVDVQTSTQVYGEILKNLELAKISLMQDKPLIQVIDKPVIPLEIDRVSKAAGIIIGFILMGFFTAILLLIRRFLY
ncbi:lipopolysaccharide biosynthesis protein [Mucilaginibacter dorajii]|uniref:Lipopolysaccharide biosynthesis protein n=1 Tax=Mucilaginibacter dorajii TaxID=692994 RepID=A0ABP7RBQ7_9SPHI|nr:lipopolysaccharide biosynthesis protein [Mucilaginibacter dorajii]MCS3736700.1 hypothetical protein [Mucilaginibacter dorajii]